MATQDLPPPGGFGSIAIERTMPRPIIRQGIMFALGVGLSIFGVEYLREWRKRYRIVHLEKVEHYIATHPFMAAEQERKFLLHLYRRREEERELMKDHPHWQLGTLYGEKVFKTMPPGYIPFVPPIEFMGLRPEDEWDLERGVPDFWY